MRRCPNCNEENDERARFCWSCGAALEGKRSATAEERKVVSVLFVDLVGFTARSDRRTRRTSGQPCAPTTSG